MEIPAACCFVVADGLRLTILTSLWSDGVFPPCSCCSHRWWQMRTARMASNWGTLGWGSEPYRWITGIYIHFSFKTFNISFQCMNILCFFSPHVPSWINKHGSLVVFWLCFFKSRRVKGDKLGTNKLIAKKSENICWALDEESYWHFYICDYVHITHSPAPYCKETPSQLTL